MSDPATSTLSKMIAAGATRAASDTIKPTKAARLSMARAADSVLGLSCTVLGVREERLGLAEMLDRIAPEDALILLDGPDDRSGLISLDSGFLSAVVEMQTVGFLLPGEGDNRKPTATDIAMTEPVINEMLNAFADQLAEADGNDWAEGFHTALMLSSVKAAALVLGDLPYRVLHMRLDLEDGTRQAKVSLILPTRAAQAGEIDETIDQAAWRAALHENLSQARVRLRTVLHTASLPLPQFTGLQVGDTLQLPLGAVGDVRLETADGTLVATAKLGQANGHRALRVNSRANGAEQFNADAPAGDAFADAGMGNTLPAMDVPGIPDPLAQDPAETAVDPLADLSMGAESDGLADLGTGEGGMMDLGDLSGGLDDLPGGLDDLPSLSSEDDADAAFAALQNDISEEGETDEDALDLDFAPLPNLASG